MASMEPKQLVTTKETFYALADQFGFDKRISDIIIDCGVTDLETFSWLFTKPDEVGPLLCDPIKDLDKPMAQVAKVRRAWAACVAYVKSRETARTRSAADDLDDVLPAPELLDIKNAFFRRYRMTYPPEMLPSDRLVSRLVREVQKRSLSMKDILTVFTLFQQKTSAPKRQKVGDNLYTGLDLEENTRRARTWSDYLDALHIYCVALAMAGCAPMEPAPSAPETLGESSTDYVQVPLDLVMRYWFRCKRTVQHTLEPQRYLQLVSLDEAERAQWVARFCQGTESLGKVIDQVYKERDAHWSVVQRPVPTEPSMPPPLTLRPNASSSRSSQKFAGELRDGTVICPDFQTGSCANQSAKGCGRGEHRCGVYMRSGRVCGSRSHIGSRCDAKGRS